MEQFQNLRMQGVRASYTVLTSNGVICHLIQPLKHKILLAALLPMAMKTLDLESVLPDEQRG